MSEMKRILDIIFKDTNTAIDNIPGLTNSQRRQILNMVVEMHCKNIHGHEFVFEILLEKTKDKLVDEKLDD